MTFHITAKSRFLIVSVFLFLTCTVTALLGQGLKPGSKVRFVDEKGVVKFGTIRSILSPQADIVTPEGKSVRFKTEEIISYKSTGETRTITPNWSSTPLTKRLYSIVLTKGETLTGGWIGGAIWWIDGPDGSITRKGGSWFLSIEPMEPPPDPEIPPNQVPPPSDIRKYAYLELSSTSLSVNLDEWGNGYINDKIHNKWVRIPQLDRIQPAYTQISDTMVLLYGIGSAAVYDIEKGGFVVLPSHNGRKFSGFSRSKTQGYAAQCNRNLALAAGTNWGAVYDYTLHRWTSFLGGADDSTDALDQNLVLEEESAYIKILNNGAKVYRQGSGRFIDPKTM